MNGRVGQITQSQAQSRGLPCYGSREEAARNCSRKEESTKPSQNKPTPRPTRRPKNPTPRPLG
jgi:hypothetical protein